MICKAVWLIIMACRCNDGWVVKFELCWRREVLAKVGIGEGGGVCVGEEERSQL